MRYFIFPAFLVFFLTGPLAGAAPPYPTSAVITDVAWAPTSEIIRKASGADNWPVTWADDNNLYGAGGDSHGAFQSTSTKYSCIVSRITGDPPSISGQDRKYLTTGDGASGEKGCGVLFVDGVLYMFVRNANKAGDQSRLLWSTDYGANWTWAAWRFEEFGWCTFLNFGQAYAGARDTFVYVYSHDDENAYTAADRMILMRVSKNRIKEEGAYEYFKGLDNGQPVWSSSIAERGAVFAHAGKCFRNGISYNAPLGRYLWWQVIPGGDTRFSGGFAIYDAPEPWGPWTTVYWNESWDTGPGDMGNFPTKWMSSDGKTCWLVFSGNDHFSVRKATFTASGTPVHRGGRTQDGSMGLSVFPNPFNTEVTIMTRNPATGPQFASFKIYGVDGRLISILPSAFRMQGDKMTWDASGRPPGNYILRAGVGSRVFVKNLVLRE